MNPIDQQSAMVDQLYRIVRGSCSADATSASCRFGYLTYEDGSSSVSQAFLDRKLVAPVMSLVKNLHASMKAHTSGDWRTFVLSIKWDGDVSAKFEYPEDASFAWQGFSWDNLGVSGFSPAWPTSPAA